MLIEVQMRPKNQPSRLHIPQVGTGFQAQKRSGYDVLCRNCDILALFSGQLWQFELSTTGRIFGFLSHFSNSLPRKQNEGLGG